MSERSLIKIGDKEIKITFDNSHIGIDLPSNETVLIDNTNQSSQISPFGILNEERIEYTSVKETNLQSLNIPKEDLWLSLYGLWSCQSDTDQIPVTVKSVQNYLDYLLQTGLGYYSPVDTSVIILNRQSFWQGAGAPLEYHWLRSPVPSTDFSPISNFPYIQSFTRDTHVLQLHPLRPPKPTPGTKFYERFIPAVGQTISFVHIDGSNNEHFEAYKRWQNSDRVNVGWRERGPDEKHHQYIKDRLADKHMMGFVFCWDGELAGYGELAWVKEDPINTYCGGMNDYDQGIHLLVGEERFRGRERFIALVTSMMHCCFLRDSRTDNVVIEPRYDLGMVPRLKALLPIELNREFEFPHKRAVYFKQRRLRFFQAASLK